MSVSLKPQEGPQTAFLETAADIAIYGGAAGGGKSYALLIEPLRHHDNEKFGCVIFRRNSTQVRNEGGLWDESMSIYSLFKANGRRDLLEWNFPSGMRVKFAHLEHDNTVFDWQGAQIPLIGFDELTHFTETQFFYMLSRNRSTSGVPGYIRATTNPDPDSWVRKFIDWWIDKEGYAIPERSGKLRWFIRLAEEMIWADTPDEIFAKYGRDPEIQPKSVTFIAAKLEDNKILMQKDPGYLANLLAMSRVDRIRLRGGNWNVRAVAGMMFRREWFPLLDAIPSDFIGAVRYWDRAATPASESNKDPDWTRGLKLLKYPNGTYLITDIRSLRDTPLKVETLIKATAAYDTTNVKVMSQIDPGSAGIAESDAFVRMLAGYDVETELLTKNKETRAKPVSAQVEAGNVFILRGAWNDDFFSEVENFPDGAHDDQVDVLSGAFNALAHGLSIADVL